jgi:hypothetical protein
MAQRKESKANIKVRDLKPQKDAKGGMVASNQTRHQNNSFQGGTQQSTQQTRFI